MSSLYEVSEIISMDSRKQEMARSAQCEQLIHDKRGQ